MSMSRSTPATSEPLTTEDAPRSRLVMKQYGKIKDMDRTFDVAFWQAQEATARLNAGWEMVEFYTRLKGGTDELRLQRTVETFQRQRG